MVEKIRWNANGPRVKGRSPLVVFCTKCFVCEAEKVRVGRERSVREDKVSMSCLDTVVNRSHDVQFLALLGLDLASPVLGLVSQVLVNITSDHSLGPSGLFHATSFSRADLPLHERTFSIAHASRANHFM